MHRYKVFSCSCRFGVPRICDTACSHGLPNAKLNHLNRFDNVGPVGVGFSFFHSLKVTLQAAHVLGRLEGVYTVPCATRRHATTRISQGNWQDSAINFCRSI